MALLEYHLNARGYPGFTVPIAATGGTYANNREVVPAHANVDSTGAEIGTVANPFYMAPAASGTSRVTGSFTAAAANAYLTGTGASTGISAAFTEIPGHAIWVKLRGNNPATNDTAPGTFAATVIVLRSADGGQSWDPLTVGGAAYASFTGNCDEAVSAEDDGAVLYRLACTAYTSGTVYYSLGHK